MEIENRRKPLAKKDNIAIWRSDNTSTGKKTYKASIDQINGERKYVTIFPDLGSIKLMPEEILEIMNRNKIKLDGHNEKGPFECTVVNRGISTSQVQKGANTYYNHTLNLGVAYHKKDPAGYLCGFSCNGVGFFKDVIHKDDSLEITPEECFDLLDGKTIFKENREASLNFLKTNSLTKEQQENPELPRFKTARIDIRKDLQSIGRNPQDFSMKY